MYHSLFSIQWLGRNNIETYFLISSVIISNTGWTKKWLLPSWRLPAYGHHDLNSSVLTHEVEITIVLTTTAPTVLPHLDRRNWFLSHDSFLHRKSLSIKLLGTCFLKKILILGDQSRILTPARWHGGSGWREKIMRMLTCPLVWSGRRSPACQ